MKKTILFIESLPESQTPLGPVEALQLNWEERNKARRKATTTAGTEVALSLPRGCYLRPGMLLYNSREISIVVQAKREAVLAIYPSNVEEACRVAHHLGNWHRSIEVTDRAIFAQPDQPLRDWLTKSGTRYEQLERVFEPDSRCSAHD